MAIHARHTDTELEDLDAFTPRYSLYLESFRKFRGECGSLDDLVSEVSADVSKALFPAAPPEVIGIYKVSVKETVQEFMDMLMFSKASDQIEKLSSKDEGMRKLSEWLLKHPAPLL